MCGADIVYCPEYNVKYGPRVVGTVDDMTIRSHYMPITPEGAEVTEFVAPGESATTFSALAVTSKADVVEWSE